MFGDTGGANEGASEPGEGNEVHARYTSGRKRRIGYCGETGAGIFIEAQGMHVLPRCLWIGDASIANFRTTGGNATGSTNQLTSLSHVLCQMCSRQWAL